MQRPDIALRYRQRDPIAFVIFLMARFAARGFFAGAMMGLLFALPVLVLIIYPDIANDPYFFSPTSAAAGDASRDNLWLSLCCWAGMVGAALGMLSGIIIGLANGAVWGIMMQLTPFANPMQTIPLGSLVLSYGLMLTLGIIVFGIPDTGEAWALLLGASALAGLASQRGAKPIVTWMQSLGA